MQTLTRALLLTACLPLAALAQDGPTPPADGPKRVGVIVVQEDDGEGPSEPEVIILEGDDLDGFEFTLDGPPPLPHGELRRVGKLKVMGPDGEPVVVEMDMDGEGGPEQLEEHMQRLRARLEAQGVKLPAGSPLTEGFDPAQLAERAAKARAARAKRERDSALAALALDPETQAVIAPLLDRVLEAKRELMRGQTHGQRLLRKDLELAAGDDAIRGLLTAYRERTAGARQTLKSARETLRELLTVQQELQLVLRDVLD